MIPVINYDVYHSKSHLFSDFHIDLLFENLRLLVVQEVLFFNISLHFHIASKNLSCWPPSSSPEFELLLLHSKLE